MKILGKALLGAGLLVGLWAYFESRADYSPKKICAKQTKITLDQCLAQIEFARSAGW